MVVLTVARPETKLPLSGLKVISFEARMRDETRRLLERQGASVVSAPAVQENAHVDQSQALAFGERMFRGEVDVLVLLTGVGTRLLIDTLATRWSLQQVLDAFAAMLLVCRGPKPAAALKAVGLKPGIVVAEPNTWRDIVAAFDERGIDKSSRVVVQEYGRTNAELLQALRARAKTVDSVSLYGWTMPDDLEPLKLAVAALTSRSAHIACFTTGVQADHLFALADSIGKSDELRHAFATTTVVTSIGPMTTDRLLQHGVTADIEPEHPKLGHLVQALVARAGATLAEKTLRAKSLA